MKLLLPVITAVITAAVCIILARMLGYYPFGDKTILYADADQHLGMYGYLSNLSSSVNDLKYSWSMVLGNGNIANFAYYYGGPLAVIFVLFPNNLILNIHIITLILIVLSSLHFCILLMHTHQKEDWMMIPFSISYALMGYSIAYIWFAGWLSGVALLPLVILGLFHLMKEGRGSLYAFSIGLCLVSNFYTGYMLCISALIAYVFCVLWSDQPAILFKRTWKDFLIYSLSGGCLSAFLTLPTFFALPEGRSTSFLSFLNDLFYPNLNPLYFPQKFLTGSTDWDDMIGTPIIFCGVLTFLLDLVYLFNPQIEKKKRKQVLILVLIFFACFASRGLSMIWHGFSIPAGFTFRNSFIFSFLMLMTAYESYVRAPHCLKLYGFPLLITGLCGAYSWFMPYAVQTRITIMIDIIFIIVGTLILASRGENHFLQWILSAAMIADISANAYLTLSNYSDHKDVLYSEYREDTDHTKQQISLIRNDDFYRMDKALYQSRCDAMLNGYYGVTDFSSEENKDILDFVADLGMRQRWMLSSYTVNAPYSTDCLLGIRYVISSETLPAKNYQKIQLQSDIWENHDALPLMFAGTSIIHPDRENLNSFELSNLYWSSIEEKGRNVFEKADYEMRNDAGNGILHIALSITSDEPVYMNLPVMTYMRVYYTVNGRESHDISYDNASRIYLLGKFEPTDQIDIYIDEASSEIDAEKIVFYYENQELIHEIATKVQRSSQHIHLLKSSKIGGTVTTDFNSPYIMTTIPYDENWRVYIDGERTSIENNWNYFICLHPEAGEHEILMVYKPKGLKEGSIISTVSIILLILEICCRKMKKGENK